MLLREPIVNSIFNPLDILRYTNTPSRRQCILLVLLALLSFSGCQSKNSQNVVQRDNESDVFLVESEDPEMLAAIQQAQDTFDEFEDYYQSGRSDLVYFSVKVRFPIPDDPSGGEHIWLYDVVLSDGQIAGKIGNEPLDAVYLSLDQEVTADLSDFSDWMVVDETGQLFGGFTLRVLRNRMTEKERQQFDEELGLIFDNKSIN